MTTQIYKFAGDPPGASAPPAVGAPTLGGPSPGAPKAPAVPTLGHVPGPRMGGGMPSITRNLTLKKATYTFKSAEERPEERRTPKGLIGGVSGGMAGLAASMPALLKSFKELPMKPPEGWPTHLYDRKRDNLHGSIAKAVGVTLAGATFGTGVDYLTRRLGEHFDAKREGAEKTAMSPGFIQSKVQNFTNSALHGNPTQQALGASAKRLNRFRNNVEGVFDRNVARNAEGPVWGALGPTSYHHTLPSAHAAQAGLNDARTGVSQIRQAQRVAPGAMPSTPQYGNPELGPQRSNAEVIRQNLHNSQSGWGSVAGAAPRGAAQGWERRPDLTPMTNGSGAPGRSLLQPL